MTLLGIALCVIGILLLSHSLRKQSLIRALAREVRAARERDQEMSIRIDDLSTKVHNTVTQLSKLSGILERRVENLEERIAKGAVPASGLSLVTEADRELQDRIERLEKLTGDFGDNPGSEIEKAAEESTDQPAPSPVAPSPSITTPTISLHEIMTPWRELLYREVTVLASSLPQNPRKAADLLRKALRDHHLDSLIHDDFTTQLFHADNGGSNGSSGSQGVSPAALAALLEQTLSQLFQGSSPPELIPSTRRLRTLLLVGAEGSGKTTASIGLAHEALKAGGRVILADCTAETSREGLSLAQWTASTGLDVVAPIVNSKPHHVAYKAIHRAQDEKCDLLILDTPPALGPKAKISESVTHIAAMIAREQPYPPHDTVLVLDASQPEQAVQQGKRLLSEGSFSGLLLSHLDAMPTPGVVSGIAQALELPVWYLVYGSSGRECSRFNPVIFSRALWGSVPAGTEDAKVDPSSTEEVRAV